MKKTLLLGTLIIISTIFIGCKNDPEINSPIDLIDDMYDNIPVTVNTENSFTFTIVANDITYSKENFLNFTKDSLVTTVTLTNVVSRGSNLEILDVTNKIIFRESLNENKVSVNTAVNGSVQKKLMIDLNDFSGKLTIVVAPKNPK